jgi:hypothetical protein
MSYKKCEKCGEYHFDTEKCGEIFNVFHEEYLGEQPKQIRAHSHEEAAEKYGEYYNKSSDYDLMDEEITVIVERQGILKKYSVFAEQKITYHTNHIN